MKQNSILFSEKNVLFKYNTKNDSYEWDVEFEYNVYGIVRIDDFVFVTTYSNWGKNLQVLLILAMVGKCGPKKYIFTQYISLMIC